MTLTRERRARRALSPPPFFWRTVFLFTLVASIIFLAHRTVFERAEVSPLAAPWRHMHVAF